MRYGTFSLLALAVSLAIACAFVRSSRTIDPEPGETGVGSGAAAPHSDRGAERLAAVDAPAVRVAAASEPARAQRPAASLDVLVTLERAFASGNQRAIDAAVLALMAEPGAVPACLDALREGTVASAAERQAASLFLTTACALDPAPHATRAAVIRELATLPEDARETLVHMLAGTRGPAGPILDASVVPQVLEALRLHPEAAESLAPLLEPSAWDRAALADQRGALVELAASSGSPAIAEAALRALWTLDPLEAEAASLLGAAARDERPGMQRARTEAAAAAAPLDRALELVANGAAVPEFGALRVLGDREGALDALRDEYSSLALAGGPASRRVALVAAMHREDPATLVGIARSDPDPRVREQALLTLTASRAVGVEAVQALRDLRADRGFGIPASTALAAAQNVLVMSSGAARDEARALLAELAADPTLSAAARRRAAEALEVRASTTGAPMEGLATPPGGGPQAGK